MPVLSLQLCSIADRDNHCCFIPGLPPKIYQTCPELDVAGPGWCLEAGQDDLWHARAMMVYDEGGGREKLGDRNSMLSYHKTEECGR